MKLTKNEIKERILNDTYSAKLLEYMLSKAIADGISTTVKFIYKRHKIIKDRRRYYSIYRLDNGKKIYSKIKYQDMAKYIIDNINDCGKIQDIFLKEERVSRLQDKINFLKHQYTYSHNKDSIESKLESAYTTYRLYKHDFLKTLNKNNVC
jgi:hypothetical protein